VGLPPLPPKSEQADNATAPLRRYIKVLKEYLIRKIILKMNC
jgi:hypothetical protein